jgi:hypothetical protein
MSRSKFRPKINLSSSPRWWNNITTERPNRQMARRLERQVVQGADPDAMIWPLPRKPHLYFW